MVHYVPLISLNPPYTSGCPPALRLSCFEAEIVLASYVHWVLGFYCFVLDKLRRFPYNAQVFFAHDTLSNLLSCH